MEGHEDRAAGSSSSSTVGGESMITDYGRNENSCGYCKSGDRNSITHGLWAHSLRVDDYQELLDRGWRRSGSFLYKPDMERTCCPSYTIRLKVDDFVPSKEQVRVHGRMQRWVPFQMAKPLLDKQPYVVLSDFIGMESLSTFHCRDEEDGSGQKCLSPLQNGEEEAVYDGYKELKDYFYSSDSDVETTADNENGDIGEAKIRMSNTCMQFKDLVKDLDQNKRRLINSLERQLRRYTRVVGPSLSKNMIYLLGWQYELLFVR